MNEEYDANEKMYISPHYVCRWTAYYVTVLLKMFHSKHETRKNEKLRLKQKFKKKILYKFIDNY